MTTLRPQYPLTGLCRVLVVSRSGYHAWTRRRPSNRTQENARVDVATHDAPVRTRKPSGPDRLRVGLKDDGFADGVCRIEILPNNLGLPMSQQDRFSVNTVTMHHSP